MYTSMFRKAMLGDTALLSLDFTTGTVPTALTFTRADSTARATFIDASGYVKTVASAGAARFDYTGGVAKGLLIEASATNKALDSESLPATANPYLYNGTTRTVQSSDPNPRGTLGSISFAPTANGSNNFFGPSIAGFLTTSKVTFSIWVKANGTNSGVFLLFCSGTLVNSSGVIISQPAGASASFTGNGSVAPTITNLSATGWTRIAVTTDVNFSGVGNFDAFFYPKAISGQLTTDSLYIWGAQAEQSSNASSYIPTTTAALTRLADDAVIRSTAWTSLYAQPGAMVVEFYRGAYGAGSRSVLATDTTAARHWDLLHANGSATSQIAFSSGSAVTQTGLVSGLNKVALAWNAPSPTASFDLCVNGATPTFGGSNVGTTLSTWLTLGSQSTTGVSGTGTWDNYLNNSIKSVKYYTGLTYAEMQAKTT
jgi:hypothetical protein